MIYFLQVIVSNNNTHSSRSRKLAAASGFFIRPAAAAAAPPTALPMLAEIVERWCDSMAKKKAEKKKNKGLSPKQEAFCLAYAASGNATQAYKAAGYKVKDDNSAAAGAVQLLRNINVKRRLREIADEVQSKRIMDIKEIQERLSDIGRQETTEEYITMEGIRMEKHVAAKDALKAMELLGKIQGAFVDRSQVELSGAVPIVIKDDI